MLESPDKHTHCSGAGLSLFGEGKKASASPAPSRRDGEPEANPTDPSKSLISSPASAEDEKLKLQGAKHQLKRQAHGCSLYRATLLQSYFQL